METALLLPAEFEVLDTCVGAEAITVCLAFASSIGYCPLCHSSSSHLHSHYQRKVGDLPISGKCVSLRLCSRKFFCDKQNCPRKVFAQQVPEKLKPYARRVERANRQVLPIGLEMGSKPGARICSLTGVTVSASTVLRTLKSAPVPPATTPRVLGVDDFAFRKRDTYGTILVDREKGSRWVCCPTGKGKPWRSGSKAIRG